MKFNCYGSVVKIYNIYLGFVTDINVSVDS